ncbi:hypothetical protein BSKO_10449 [Bryopsis sp. KO-2023]|nr:hypothetical protein BSKO_10449 [Bryopsis sp. KO-2023]
MMSSIQASLKKTALDARSDLLMGRGGLTNIVDHRFPDPLKFGPMFAISVALFGQTVMDRVISRPDGRPSLPLGVSVVILTNALVFFKPGGVSSAAVSLSPHRVIERHEFGRLIRSSLVHVDFQHFILNMRSVLEFGAQLEEFVPPVSLLADVASLTVVSQSMYVGFAWAEYKFFGVTSAYYDTRIVGFSAVGFALQVIAGYLHDGELADDQDSLYIPPQYLCWLSLIASQVFFPGTSFQGHFCGILSGLLRVFVPRPFLWVRRRFVKLFRGLTGRRVVDNERDEVVIRRRRGAKNLLWHTVWGLVSFGILTALKVQGAGRGSTTLTGKCPNVLRG